MRFSSAVVASTTMCVVVGSFRSTQVPPVALVSCTGQIYFQQFFTVLSGFASHLLHARLVEVEKGEAKSFERFDGELGEDISGCGTEVRIKAVVPHVVDPPNFQDRDTQLHGHLMFL